MSRSGQSNVDSCTAAEASDVDGLDAGSEVEVSTVPDGGWGWIVVLGTFMIHVIAHGILYSFGIFVEEFVDYFECSRSVVGGISSLMLGATWGSGNLAELITSPAGIRCKVLYVMITY